MSRVALALALTLAGCNALLPLDPGSGAGDGPEGERPDIQHADGAGDAGSRDGKSPADGQPDGPRDQLATDAVGGETLPLDAQIQGDGGGGGVALWGKRFGENENDLCTGIAVNGSTVYMVGTFSGTTDFGGGPVTAPGGRDIVVAAYDASGTYKWAHLLGGPSQDTSTGVAVGPNGNVIVTGYFPGGGFDCGNGKKVTTKGYTNVLLAGLDAAGQALFCQGYGEQYGNLGTAVAVDGQSNIYLTGVYSDDLTIGSVAVPNTSGNDVLLASFDASGAVRWAKGFGGAGSQKGLGLAVGGSGELYLVGTWLGALDLGGGPLTPAPLTYFDLFVARLSSSTGGHVWSKTFGGTGNDEAQDVAVDPAGNIYVAGTHEGGLAFGAPPTPWASNGGTDIFLASFTAAGAPRWSKSYGSAQDDRGLGVTAGAGAVYLTGLLGDAADLGAGTLGFGGADLFVVSLTTGGGHRWSQVYGDGGYDAGEAIAAGGGALYVGGRFAGDMALGTKLTSAGVEDGVIGRLAP